MAAMFEGVEISDGTRTICVTVPREEAIRLRTDPPYAQKVFENNLKEIQEETLIQPSDEVGDTLDTSVDISKHSTLETSVNDDQPESHPSGSKITNRASAIGLLWTDNWTKHLLDLCAQYMKQVGSSKTFKTNKDMWHQVAKDINAVHNTAITGRQCESRFNTVKRRKIREKHFKRTSGEAAYQDEWEQLESQDDSIMPEVQLGIGHCAIIKAPPSSSSVLCSRSFCSSEPAQKPKRIKTSAKVLEDGIKRLIESDENYEKLRSEAKERHHQEKIALLKELLSKD